ALIAYNETIKLFPHEVVARNGKASLLILMDKLEDAVKYIKNDYPQSKEDWINYHISAMYYLKTGDITKAIKRLEYGYENVPFSNSRKYFEGALAFARIQNKEYDKAEKVLRCAIAVITVAAMNPKCLILLIHSQLERPDKRQEAIKHLAILQDAKNPIIITLRDNLWKMYDAFERQSDSEIKALRIEIIKKEELLVSA
ncbi:MAG: hypothetical protein L7F77_12415, partial [Candidatus Magnetominusculus sp. LBB02]|nr:hypothetical protein [Candidatus Magnetominusculus sp. LBB02]